MFFKIVFTISFLIGTCLCETINVPTIVSALKLAAPQLIGANTAMNNGRSIMANGKSFSTMMNEMNANINLIGSGYTGNAAYLMFILNAFQQGGAGDAGDISIPTDLFNTITNSLENIALGWSTVYEVNAKIGQIVLNNENLLSDVNNVIPKTLVISFTTTEAPMVTGFAQMSNNSRIVGNAFNELAQQIDENDADLIRNVAQKFINESPALETASQVLANTNEQILNLSPPTVGNFLAAFNTELNNLSSPYTALEAIAIGQSTGAATS